MRSIRLIALPAAMAVVLVLAAVALANGGGKGFDTTFKGTEGNDTFAGTAGKDLAIGKKGDDNLSGAAANDWLFGGSGKDTLNGGDDNDKLFGGADDDALDGGPGDDVLVSAVYRKQRRGGRACDTSGRNVGCVKRGRNFGGERRGGKRSWRWVVAPQGTDTVTCGAGEDKVFADKDDVVAADCEKVVRLEDKTGKRDTRRK